MMEGRRDRMKTDISKFLRPLLAVVLLLVPIHVRADSTLTPLRRAVILSRIISYDKDLIGGAETFTVAVLAKPGNPSSVAEANALFTAFVQVGAEAKLNGALLKAARLDFTDQAAFEAGLVKFGAKAVYLTEGLEADVDKIKQSTRKRSVLSMCGQAAVVRAGISVGVYVQEDKSRMSVNLTASQAEGISFPPEFLRLAEIVR
jgi:hypothetical protein